jgi:hypothetical protein
MNDYKMNDWLKRTIRQERTKAALYHQEEVRASELTGQGIFLRYSDKGFLRATKGVIFPSLGLGWSLTETGGALVCLWTGRGFPIPTTGSAKYFTTRTSLQAFLFAEQVVAYCADLFISDIKEDPTRAAEEFLRLSVGCRDVPSEDNLEKHLLHLANESSSATYLEHLLLESPLWERLPDEPPFGDYFHRLSRGQPPIGFGYSPPEIDELLDLAYGCPF